MSAARSTNSARHASSGFGLARCFRRGRAWRLILALIPVFFACPAAEAQEDRTDPALLTDEMMSMMPDRERTLIHLLMDARRQYEAASPGEERQQCRLSMQIGVTRFLGSSPNVENWIGVFRSSYTNQQGDRRIRIEIAPGVILATGQNRQDDPNLLTLIEPHSDTYRIVDTIGIGQTIIFSGRILAAKLSTDDDMVEQPLLFAHFSTLKRAR
jgi:hypothetical protein